jgi:hypothetical protein
MIYKKIHILISILLIFLLLFSILFFIIFIGYAFKIESEIILNNTKVYWSQKGKSLILNNYKTLTGFFFYF